MGNSPLDADTSWYFFVRAGGAGSSREARLGFFVVEHLDSLKVRMTLRLFHFGVWFVDLPRHAFGITPFFCSSQVRHGDTVLKKDVSL